MNRKALALLLTAAVSPAFAGTLCTGVSLGTSSTSDVTLSGNDSDQCVISTVNAQSGPSGDTSGFSGAFGGGWSLLAKIDASGNINPDPGSNSGVSFDLGFATITSKNGTWSITANDDVTVDLVFAMHASNRSGAFLFDDLGLTNDTLASGTWVINWVNNGGNRPDYSNLTLFVRDVRFPPPPVPAPEGLGLLGLGLIGLGSAARRK